MERWTAAMPPYVWMLGVLAAAVGAALAVHWIAYKMLSSAGPGSRFEVRATAIRLRSPTRWAAIAIAVSAVQPSLELGNAELRLWNRIAGLVVPALVGWVIVAALGAASEVIKSRADINVADNLVARRRRTRVDILHRVAVATAVGITFCLMLMSIPSVRSIGVTLAASAGLAALAVGAAAQPALKNLVAGIQMAFTEPIRLDDVVIVEGEWGRIEDIRLTYVVVKIWDERRLIVPVSRFLEQSFQNWTRSSSEITGSVFWYLDPATDVARLREKLQQLVEANRHWDKRFCNLQVTDAKPEAIEVRALMTARNASETFDLRCEVREAMLEFIRAEMPEALVRQRGEIELLEPTLVQS